MTTLFLSLLSLLTTVCSSLWFHHRGEKRGDASGYQRGHQDGYKRGREDETKWWLDMEQSADEVRVKNFWKENR